jgi:hypothetical protein
VWERRLAVLSLSHTLEVSPSSFMREEGRDSPPGAKTAVAAAAAAPVEHSLGRRKGGERPCPCPATAMLAADKGDAPGGAPLRESGRGGGGGAAPPLALLVRLAVLSDRSRPVFTSLTAGAAGAGAGGSSTTRGRRKRDAKMFILPPPLLLLPPVAAVAGPVGPLLPGSVATLSRGLARGRRATSACSVPSSPSSPALPAASRTSPPPIVPGRRQRSIAASALDGT